MPLETGIGFDNTTTHSFSEAFKCGYIITNINLSKCSAKNPQLSSSI